MMDDEYQRQLAQYNDEMSRWEREEYGPYKAQLEQSGQGFAPSMPLAMARGGEVDLAAVNASNLADEEDETINTNPVGTAQRLLANLTGQADAQEAPTRQTVKRVRAAPSSSKGVKGMTLEYESLTRGDLGAMQDFKPKFKESDSARAQLEDLARQYQLKLAAVKNRSRGLAADTFGAPTLEGPTLTKSRLTRRRFAEGGEVKEEPSIFGVTDYAARTAKQMFPEQMGQDDQRDAARHMLAAGTVARKYGPQAAMLLGKAHERMSNPQSFFNMLGVGQARYDYDVDMHNNRVGVELAARTKSQAELERLVRAMAQQAITKQTPGRPMVLSREQLEAIDEQNRRAATPPPEYRAKGSSKEGEVAEPTEAELVAARRPVGIEFAQKSGIGRKQSITSGQANDAVLQGITELPYNLAGAFVDIPTMVMRPFGYSNPTPFLGSDYLKRKATELGIRPEPPKEPAARALYEVSQLGSSLVNPAAATRSVVRGAQRVGQAAGEAARDFQQYNQQLAVPGASYARRPEGSALMVRQDKNPNWVGTLLETGVRDARDQLANMTHTTDRAALMEDFWNKKAANYFIKQFGTESDPIYRGIREQTITSPALKQDFPSYILDQLTVGKTRAKEGARPADDFVGPGAPEMRFFPKYPEAFDEMRSRYDRATNIEGAVPVTNPASVMSPDFTYTQTREGLNLLEELRNKEIDRMIAQGTPASQASPVLEFLTRSAKAPETVVGPYGAKSLLTDYEAATGTRVGDLNFRGVPQPDALPQNLRTAVEKGEIVYSTGTPDQAVRKLFDTKAINEYLATVPERELKNLRFEDAVRGGAKISAKRLERETLAADIRAGKRVPDKFFSEGVSEPLVQFKEGPFEGFAWKRIKDADATVPEGAYVGHSVGGYAKGGNYGPETHKQFIGGEMQVFTLRDNRNRPVTTIEVDMTGSGPRVKQIKGNGRATGNAAPEKYDEAVLGFFQNYLKPTQISESDQYLTPLLKSYKEALKQEQLRGEIGGDLMRDLGLE